MTIKPTPINRRKFLKNSAKVGLALAAAPASSNATAKQTSAMNKSTDITAFTATQLSSAIKLKKVSCVEVMQAYLDRIDKYNPVYNAIVYLQDNDDLLAQAASADAALVKGEYWGWMHGLPHAVKDLSNVRGIVTSSGSPIFKNNVAKDDDIFVARIRNQGAIFIGKTNVPEFGLGSQSYNPVHGVTRNAYDSALCAGGSSGGASVGMATNMLPIADGSDMMGSLRNPAAYNNVVGFRPSQGRVPSGGGDLFFQQLGYSGPMGRNVEDTHRLLLTMAGYDSRAPLSLTDRLDPSPLSPTPLKKIKVGWMGDFMGYLPMEKDVLELCENALSNLAEEGLIIGEAMPEFDMGRLWQTWLALRHWTIAGLAKPLYDKPEWKALLNPEAVWEIEGGLRQTGLEISTASLARSEWYLALHKLFEQYDFLILPSAQVFPFAAETHWPKEVDGKTMDTYHRWMEVTISATLSGCPVVNVPVGFDVAGRPMGMQIIGPMGSDIKVLEFAAAYEAHTGFLSHRPDLVTTL